MTKDNYKIYVHINKINGKMYIGQTKQNPNERWRNGEGYKESPYFYKAITKYNWDNFHHIVLFEVETIEQANVCEEILITKYQTTNKNYGYNIARGGFNTEHSDEVKRKISISNKGKKRSEETRKKLSLLHKGRYIDNGANTKRRVNKYDLSGNLIKTYESLSEAAIDNNTRTSNIIGVCKQKNRHIAAGFIWAYEGEIPVINYIKKIPQYKNGKHSSAKTVIQYNKNMEYLNSYKSTLEAGINTGIDHSCIAKVCNNKRKTAGGYIWRYKDEVDNDKN